VKSLNSAAAFLGTALGLAAAAASVPAYASLGADRSSVEADRSALHGQISSATTASGFEIQEITTPAGVHVREYLSAQGKVFALSWQGPVRPDLRQMLGSYYARYAQAVTEPHVGGHRHLTVHQPGLVVESNGRMRAFYGRAWDPDSLPADFSPADIR
jgi:hypothetical protein